METKMFKNLEEQALLELNGGGFAYDAGRVVRWIGQYFANAGGVGGSSTGVTMACIDWQVNELVNKESQ